MGKELIYGLEAKEKLKEGVVDLAKSVKVTLGAKGRNVIIDNGYGSPIITKDGVTVARNIDFDEPIKNMGARLIKDVAQKTNDLAGDGTTTASVLAEAMFLGGIKMIAVGGHPILIKNGMDKACSLAVKLLGEMTEKIDNNFERVVQIANISANGDKEVSGMISGAIQQVSHNGVITVEESRNQESTLEIIKGMQFPKGYLSPYFMTDKVREEVVFENPLILLCANKISSLEPVMPALEFAVKERRPIVIIADSVDSEALALLVVNKLKGGLPVVAIQSPSYGEMRVDMMEDLAILTGGTYFSNKKGMDIESKELKLIDFEDLGSCEKIIVSANKTIIIKGGGNKELLDERILEINSKIAQTKNDFDLEKYRERLAKLDGGVAVIYVGGNSDVEVKEKKDRYEDALNATRAAIDEGIVPGGGVALLRIHDHLLLTPVENEDEGYGVKIVCEAILAPIRQILDNAGEKVDVIINELKIKGGDWGYNVYTNSYEKFFETGVIDPSKVTRIALENATSISGMLLTTECVISQKQKEDGQQS